MRIQRSFSILLFGAALAWPAHAATIHVDTTSQAIDGTDGHCSLPEAIEAANFDVDLAIDAANPDHFVVTECVPGNGDDTIVFDLPAGSVIPMSSPIGDSHNSMGPTATPIVFTNIVIEAGGVRFEHVGNGKFRAFAVGSATVDLSPGGVPRGVIGTGNLTIRNAHIKGFAVKGGDGAGGGGGGMGAGGAIYVNGGTLTVESSTFEGNSAVGGDGSTNFDTVAGGGGGGLSGNGAFPGHGPGAFMGGGGGGGSRGNGGSGGIDGLCPGSGCEGGGGGGGGTVTSGENGPAGIGRGEGGFTCGGPGGTSGSLSGGDDGADAACPGGGGGGGASRRSTFPFSGNGGRGAYGGGGGGGGYSGSDGGDAGFGGGGGSGTTFESNLDGFGPSGGNGGFGGGGGAAHGGYIAGGPGSRGDFGGDANQNDGGGGAALGGAIFNDGGTVTIVNCTFTGNGVQHGYASGTGHWGQDAGGAIFSRNGSLVVKNSTVALNHSSADRAGITVYGDHASAAFELRNTIVAGNGPRECSFDTNDQAVVYNGSGNLIVDDFGCTGLASQDDPALGPLQLNVPGSTPTMAIDATSPAFDTADDTYCTPFDQRGVPRPQSAHCDIGAFESACVIVSCPSDIRVGNDPGACSAAVRFDLPTVDGSCTPTCDATSGSSFPVGASTVSCTADAGSCSFKIRVDDVERPTVAAPPSKEVPNDPGNCSAAVNPGTATVSDNCPGATVSGVRGDGGSLGSAYPVGTTQIAWSATDASGNVSLTPAIQTVKVDDVEPPSLSTPTSSPAALWPPNHAMRDETIGYTAADNCPGTVCTLSVTSSEPVSGLGDGDTAPDWVVQDAHHEQLRAERSGRGNGRTYTTTVTCTDASRNATTKGTTERVVHDIASPVTGATFVSGSLVKLRGSFADGAGTAHRAVWTLDGARVSGAVTEPGASGTGSVSGSAVLSIPGVYSLKMTLTDAAGQVGVGTTVDGLDSAIVVTPAADFVAGGGWINVRAGSYAADPAFAERASLAFVSTSSHTVSPAGGELELDLHREGFKFHASGFTSQTIANPGAQLRGNGTVNGAGTYKFLLSTLSFDGTGAGPTAVRLKIWNAATGAVVFDTQTGAPDTAIPTTSLGGTSPVVIED
ncbi:MAG TPA: choice-of-anchor Q domain-containing protein [Candidatus Polarisedimenticolaceae bacterium]|nr:choice-of-anchor Q domain-containing protein [Candidatus Polarisedimenticolaceae bacterium]